MAQCACGSESTFESCCEPLLKGTQKASTAESLMRSRYSAFTVADINYIEKTTDPSKRSTFDKAGTLDWAKNSEWLGLEIVSTEEGGVDDVKGVVEFIAKYRYDGVEQSHHEKSDFRKRGDEWYFVDGKLVQEPYRAEDRVGRNDPCPCGSGKKYKKCCAA